MTYIKTSSELNATGQRWINELANYNFSIHYKRGVDNPVASCLNRSPVDISDFIDNCEVECNVEEVEAILDGSVNQGYGEETWVVMVNTVNTNLDETENHMQFQTPARKLHNNCKRVIGCSTYRYNHNQNR